MRVGSVWVVGSRCWMVHMYSYKAGQGIRVGCVWVVGSRCWMVHMYSYKAGQGIRVGSVWVVGSQCWIRVPTFFKIPNSRFLVPNSRFFQGFLCQIPGTFKAILAINILNCVKTDTRFPLFL